MSEDINVTDGTVLEALNNKVDLDGGNYIGSPLEEYIHQHCASSGFNLFDTKTSDHVLEGEEALGWALQGTYVYKNGVAGSRISYADFYNRCLAEKELGTATETTLGDNTITMYVNANGHKFYDIADKDVVDTWYNTYGIADFYGVDTENERIFLPRNNKFIQLTGDTSKVNNTIEAGLPNITGTFYVNSTASESGTNGGGAFTVSTIADNQAPEGDNGSSYRFNFDASRSSSVYGKSSTVQPASSLKLLYYCVGNTKVESAVSNVTEITTSENDTLPLFYNFYSQEDMTTTGAYVNASLGSYLSGNVYPTAYNELVNKLGTDNVKANTDTYTDYDFVVNQDDMTFRLPLLNGDRVLVEKKVVTSDDTTWYNLYSDGWLEQGGGGNFLAGNNSISLVKPSSVSGAWATLNSGNYPNAERNLYIGITGAYPNHVLSLNTGSAQTEYVSWWCCGYAPNIPTNTGVNLYYKVANAVTNLEILDAGKVMNALNTVVPDNASLISSYGMCSGVMISLTPGASGTWYTAPTNGIVRAWGYKNTSQPNYINIYTDKGGATGVYVPQSWGSPNLSIRVAKGEKFQVTDYNDISEARLSFYYLKGEV